MDLPFNETSEKAVLGSILIDCDAAYTVMPILRADQFYVDKNKTIYKAVQELQTEGEPVDFVTVANQLKEIGKLDTVGGTVYLTELMESTPTSVHVEYYAKVVRDYSKLRSLVFASSRIVQTANDAGAANIDATLDKFSDLLYNALRDESDSIVSTASEMVEEYWKDFEERYKNLGQADVSTGFLELDAVVAGYNKGDLVVVAGRPSQGKTALIMGSLVSLGKAGIPTILFPYEMSRLQSTQRFVSLLSGVNLQKVRMAVGLSQEESDRITRAASEFKDLPIYLDNNSFGDVYYITAAIRRYVSRYDARVVFIDYLQIIPTLTDDLTNEYGKITRTLKSLATSLDITIVLVSQLNRAVESRADGRPKMFDLRQSGRIEEDADIVIMVYRDLNESPEDAEINTVKNRNGPTGLINLFFDSETTRFIGRGDG